MNTKLEEAKAALVQRALETGRGRVPAVFVERYWGRVAPEDIVGTDPIDLYGATAAHRRLGEGREPGTARVAVYNPTFDDHGWASTHSVVEVVNDDMPFLVDSISLELARRGVGLHLVVHPVIDGEAFLHFEIDRQPDRPHLEAIKAAVSVVLADVRAVVEDWQPMRARALALAAALQADPPDGAGAAEVREARDFLRWLADDNFVFMGFDDGAAPGLGLLRPGSARVAPEHLEGVAANGLPPLVLTRSSTPSPVHRPGALDLVIVGRAGMVGLYTSALHKVPTAAVPLVRRTVAEVVERCGFAPGSHDAKALVDVLEAYPRRELFEMSADELHSVATGILALAQRHRVRLFVRRDRFRRSWSCLVFVPLDRYTQMVRRRITDILLDAFAGVGHEYSADVSDPVLARLHFVIRTEDRAAAAPDLEMVEARVAEAAHSWADDLHDALLERHGEQRGLGLLRRYADAFPSAYRDDFPARAALSDIERAEALADNGDIALTLSQPPDGPEDLWRLKVFRRSHPVPLSDVLPILDNMGTNAVDQRPYEVRPRDGGSVWVHDYGLRLQNNGADLTMLRDVVSEAFSAVWRGAAENDGHNRLVIAAGLTWREVSVLRAYAKYLRQIGVAFSPGYIEAALVGNAEVARLLVGLFHARFDPAHLPDPSDNASVITKQLEESIDAVASLDEDRILRSFLALVQATLRTNYYAGTDPSRLAFKLDPSMIPDMPLPRPRYEIFVSSPQVEGVHLRGGKVSRGGIRWSDRKEDFRTEVLGLMKAQMVKNAVIVPVGAKGGFVVKAPNPDRDAVAAAYQAFIDSLLDITDNIVTTNIENGDVVHPAGVAVYDGDDPYLVVAADKGTATFSDLANEVAAAHGFWLGDAFASGGSSGYDHKAMGITAKGAWESVRRHFRHLGVDADRAPLTVVGIGDMSGDVFGNGLLRSPHLRLVAAFDHRHVFFDPDPDDPAASYAERDRLFRLPRSTWADYEAGLISAGGGIWSRAAKSIPLSPEVRALLAVDAPALPPHEVVRAILRAPVDLLWNGGIGTYVKAAAETHADAGDKANDPVRVDANELRARVVGEGGNLGFTQRARVEYALGGGRINTDAIDNSAGVDCSDHEVNIKVLLDRVVADGDMTLKQRNGLLADMTAEVSAMVLADNYHQTGALAVALAQAGGMADVHARYLRHLEAAGRLDRSLEALPADEALAARRSAIGGPGGLCAPEFSVLLAYTKNEVSAALLASDAPEDPWLSQELTAYFPAALRDARFAAAMAAHPLRREIIASQVTNALVDHAGTSFVFRLTEETGASVADLARAHAAARRLFDLDAFWADVDALDNLVPADVQVSLCLAARRLAERAARWLVRHGGRPLDVAATVAGFAPGLAVVEALLPDEDDAASSSGRAEWEAAGVPGPLAARASAMARLSPALGMVDVARRIGRPVDEVAEVWFALGQRLELDWLRARIVALPADDRWQALARGALGDDCDRERAALTAAVLATETGLDGWVAGRSEAVERFGMVLDDVRATAVPDLATLSVAMRELRGLDA